MSRTRRVLRKSAIVLPLLAMTSALLVAPPAVAVGSKQYVASISVVPAVSPEVTITVTFTNMPGSATLGSARVTVPNSYTGVGTPTISAVSAGKLWKASKPLNSNVITITAKSDSQKIQPGQFVSVRFNATPTSTTSNDTFVTQAKASTNFTGSSFFTNLGSDPVVTICNSGSSCTTQFGDPNAPPRDLQTAQVSLDSTCTGTCIVTLGGTAGDFCAQPPNPPSTPCRTHVGPDIKISGYSGEVTEYLSCNDLDCPPPSGGGGFAGSSFYPVWIDKSDGPTVGGGGEGGDVVLEVVDFCGEGVPTPCLLSSGRVFTEGGGSFYQSQLELTFPFDPKTLH